MSLCICLQTKKGHIQCIMHISSFGAFFSGRRWSLYKGKCSMSKKDKIDICLRAIHIQISQKHLFVNKILVSNGAVVLHWWKS